MIIRRIAAAVASCLLMASGANSAVAADNEGRATEIWRELSDIKDVLAVHTQALNTATAAKDDAEGCRAVRVMRPMLQRMYDLLVESKAVDPSILAGFGGEASLEKVQQGVAMMDKGLIEKCADLGN